MGALLQHTLARRAGLAALFALAIGSALHLQSPSEAGTPEAKQAAIDEARLAALALSRGEPGALERLRALTEEPILDDAGREARLHELRNQVQELQQQLDARDAQLGSLARSKDAAPESAGSAAAQPAPLAAQAAPRAGSPGTRATPPPARAVYSADALKQAITCVRAEQPERALALLEQAAPSAQADFWRARALARLARIDEALAAYARVLESAPASPEAALAKGEIDFLRWRRTLEPGASAPASPAPAPASAEAPAKPSAPAHAAPAGGHS